MNKKGQVMLIGIMLAVVIIILVLSFAPANKLVADEAMNSTNLNCTNPSLDNYGKANCVATDLISPYYIAIGIGIGGLIMVAKIIWG